MKFRRESSFYLISRHIGLAFCGPTCGLNALWSLHYEGGYRNRQFFFFLFFRKERLAFRDHRGWVAEGGYLLELYTAAEGTNSGGSPWLWKNYTYTADWARTRTCSHARWWLQRGQLSALYTALRMQANADRRPQIACASRSWWFF